MESMAKRAHILFKNYANEISPRFFIKQKAQELGLKGYCRINENNLLEIEVEGKEISIDEFVRFMQIGTLDRKVSNLFSIEMFDQLKDYEKMEVDIV